MNYWNISSIYPILSLYENICVHKLMVTKGVVDKLECGISIGTLLYRQTMLCCAVIVSQSCPSLCDPMDCSPPGSSVHRDSPGKNTGVDCHALLQGIFPTQGLDPGLLHCRQILYQLSHKGSPYICISTYKYTNYLHTNIHTHTHTYMCIHLHIYIYVTGSAFLVCQLKKNHSLEVENDVLFSGLFLRT